MQSGAAEMILRKLSFGTIVLSLVFGTWLGFCPGVLAGEVVFSEVFYDTPGSDNLEEWIELYNNSPVTVDISGWRIVDNNGIGFAFTIPAGETMLPYSFYTLARTAGGFSALYGYHADLYGGLPYLNNGGDTLVLRDKYGFEVDAVAWEGGASSGIPPGWGSTSDPWAPTGNSIVRIDPSADTGTYADWTYDINNGDPQTQSSSPEVNVLFSEIFYDTPGDENLEEWIELYNNSAVTVDIGLWTIVDNNGTGWVFTIPAGATMLPYSFYTLARDPAGFTALYGYHADLYGGLPYLNNGGDTLVLYDAYGSEADAVAWEGGASAGIPPGWGSTSDPWASWGESIVRNNPAVDTDTYADWTYDINNGDPGTQETNGPDTTPPVPDVPLLPDVAGECSAEITQPPTATDDRAGTVVGTTVDPLVYTSQGIYTVTWIYDDGNGNTTTQDQTVIVDDTTPPVPDQEALPTLEGECLVEITVIPTATDNCSGILAGATPDPLVYSTQGTHTVTWTFDDGNGNAATQDQTVVIEDVTPPIVASLGMTPDVIWPPNHRMVPAHVSVSASDNCDPEPQCQIVSAGSSEPESGVGTGSTASDWELTGTFDISLRAERSGKGNGRIYTVTVECADDAGNSSDGLVTALVPHDKRKKRP
jgi:hypothetical protein